MVLVSVVGKYVRVSVDAPEVLMSWVQHDVYCRSISEHSGQVACVHVVYKWHQCAHSSSPVPYVRAYV
eukprot:6986577-Prorocentrum_lima.AAC.1